MSGPRLDDPHFTPARYGLKVRIDLPITHPDETEFVHVTSVGHTGNVEQITGVEDRLATLASTVSMALETFDRDPKWTPKAKPRY